LTEKLANFLQCEVVILDVDTGVKWRDIVIACPEVSHAVNSCSNDTPNHIFAIRVSDCTKDVEEGVPNSRLGMLNSSIRRTTA
jgi:hypothetical protein